MGSYVCFFTASNDRFSHIFHILLLWTRSSILIVEESQDVIPSLKISELNGKNHVRDNHVRSGKWPR